MSPDYVVKRSGEKELVDPSKIERVCIWATQDLNIDYREVYSESKIRQFVYNGISTSTIQELIAHQFAARGQENYEYLIAASRFVLQKIRKEVNRDICAGDVAYPHIGKVLRRLCLTDGSRYDSQLLEKFDLEAINDAIKPEADLLFDWTGIRTLYDRYLAKDREGNLIEAPQHFFMRVAMGLALTEKESIRTKVAIDFYNQYSGLLALSSTPTLFNSGTKRPQLSSCFVSLVESDSLEGIFETGKENALYSKYSGGTAISLTPLRAKGGIISTTGGKSSGVVPFAKLYEQTMRGFDQGGKRPGVTCLYLETWHKDIFDFLKSVDTGQDERTALRDVNISVWTNSLFMERVDLDGDWCLFCPTKVPELHDLWGNEFRLAYEKAENDPSIPKEVVKAKVLWAEMLKTLFNRKGKGWITFKDEFNRRSPTRNYGVIHSTNLCVEIGLRNSKDETSVCNLASANLARITSVSQLETTIRTLVRMVDNAVEGGYLPHEKAQKFNKADRPLGIGVMGYTVWLVNQLGIDYESPEHLIAANALFSLINYFATDESANLAKEKGSFPNFEKSSWARGELTQDTAHPKAQRLVADAMQDYDFKNEKLLDYLDAAENLDWDALREKVKFGMRNSNLLAVAPNATISNIVGTTPCIELPYKNVFSKDNQSGDFTTISPIYQKYRGTDKEHLIKTAFCDQLWSVKAAAVRQIHIDQSQSLNIFVTGDITGKGLSTIYRTAHDLGVKSTYYLRSEAETFTNTKKSETVNEPAVCSIEDPDCEACQ